MFAEMRAALQISKSTDILDHIYALPTPEAQATAMEAIRQIERTAMASQVAQPGLEALMTYLDARSVPKGICTRNFDAPVAHLLAKFLAGSVFHPIVTRDFRPPKPDPAGILHIARSWGLVRPNDAAGADAASTEQTDGSLISSGTTTSTEPAPEATAQPPGSYTLAMEDAPVPDASGLIMVGDSMDDMTAGRRAGAATVLLVNDVNAHLADHEHTDLVIRQLDELIPILEEGFPGPGNPV